MTEDPAPLTRKQRRNLQLSLVAALLVVPLTLIYWNRTGQAASLAFTGSFLVSGIVSGYRLYRADRRNA